MSLLSRNWGWIALRGVASLLFGVLALTNPGVTLAVLVLWFGAYAVADGIFTIVSSIANRRGEAHWVALLFGGIVSLAAGVVALTMPGITALTLLYVIAFWAIVRGVAEIATAIRLRKVLSGEWMLALAGVLELGFGVLLILRPGVGALAVLFWIGAYAIIAGIVLIAVAFRLRAWGRGSGADAVPRPA